MSKLRAVREGFPGTSVQLTKLLMKSWLATTVTPRFRAEGRGVQAEVGVSTLVGAVKPR